MIAKFLPYLKSHRWRVGLALAQVFLVAAFELLKPWPLQIVIDYVLGGKTPPAGGPVGELLSLPALTLLLLACIGIVLVHFGAGALTLWHNYTTIRVGQAMVNDLRGDLYAHLQRLSLGYHGRQRVGDLMYRITADSFAVQTMIMNGLLPILSALVLLGGMLIVLFPMDPLLTVLALTIVPVLFALIAAFNRKIVDVATEVRDLESRVYSLVQWGMSAIKVVQAFTKEEEEHRRFMGASRESLRATLRLYNWQTLYSAAVNVVVAAGTAVVVYAGARAVLSGNLTLGQLLVFISYLAQLYQPINQITQSWGLIAAARVGATRVFEVLETEADLPSGTRQFPPGGVRDNRVARCPFRYREKENEYDGCQFPLPARDAGAERHRSHGRGRVEDRDRRPDRRRQIDAARAAAAVLRSDERRRDDRRRRYSRIHAELAAQPDRDGVAAAADLPAVGRRQHRLWPPRRRSRGDRERRASGAHPRHDRAHARGLRDAARRRRRRAVRRREAAHHDRPRPVARRADPDPRRADLGARRRDRGAGHGGDRDG